MIDITEEESTELLYEEIARELILGQNPQATEEEIAKIWLLCEGNLWNAQLLSMMIKVC